MRRHQDTIAQSNDAATLLDEIESNSLPLRTSCDLDPLLELVGDSHLVLLGEASHGTSEYYA